MRANINDYLSNSIKPSSTYIIGSIEIREDALDKKIEIGGGSVMKDGILVNRIDSREAMTYNLLMDNVNKGTLEITNPQDQNGFITLEILGNTTDSKLKYENDKITLIKNLKIRVAIAEIQGEAIVNNELLDYIKVAKEKEIEAYLLNSFEKYKKEGIDVFEIERLLDINYPKVTVENPISKTDLEVNVDINIEGTGRVRNSL